MSTEPTSVSMSDADVDALVEHIRRAGRPFTTEELAQVLVEIWRRRRTGR
jgi:hypothetical protein